MNNAITGMDALEATEVDTGPIMSKTIDCVETLHVSPSKMSCAVSQARESGHSTIFLTIYLVNRLLYQVPRALQVSSWEVHSYVHCTSIIN